MVYIDYGNREEIPFSMIRPLPTQFSTLPAQALSCSLRKLELPRPIPSEGRLISSIYQWLSAVLVGVRSHVIVTAVSNCNDAHVEAYIPISLLCSEESLGLLQSLLGDPPSSCRPTGLPSSVPLAKFIEMLYEHYCLLYVPELLRDDQTTPIPPPSPVPSPPLTPCNASLLSQSSLTQWPNLQDLVVNPLQTPPHCLPNEQNKEANKLQEVLSESGEKIKKQSASYDSTPVTTSSSEQCLGAHSVIPSTPVLHNKSRREDEKKTPISDSSNTHQALNAVSPAVSPVTPALTNSLSISPLTISDLQPIQLNLNVSDQINILVSHATNPQCVYVHPVLSEAHDLLQLETSLNEFYSDPIHCASLPAKFINRGNLCCIQSHDDKLWYRAVVCESVATSPPPASLLSSVVAVKRVQLFCVDYGHTLTVPVSAPVILDPSFVTTPIQCICCTLDRIKPPVIFSSPSQTAAKENSSSHASNSRVSPSDKLDRSPSSNGEHLSQGSDVPARVKGTQETQLPPLLSSGEWDEAAAELLLRVSGEKQLVGTVTQCYGEYIQGKI